ncbi:hypothetical protein ART_1875 [Arthrobacter sp. PAMC 25486]|nr:hypothetical protein ART_1875 [Arthrobacter sp. PAMC 25486]
MRVGCVLTVTGYFPSRRFSQPLAASSGRRRAYFRFTASDTSANMQDHGEQWGDGKPFWTHPPHGRGPHCSLRGDNRFLHFLLGCPEGG